MTEEMVIVYFIIKMALNTDLRLLNFSNKDHDCEWEKIWLMR